jgi:hypothetical protein
MAPAPLRPEVVRPVADDEVCECVEHQGYGKREADQRRIDADDLAVEDQEEEAEALVLDAEGGGAETIGQLRSERRAIRWR